MPPPSGNPSAPENPDYAHLWDMLAAAREVRDFAAGRTWGDYQRDLMLRRSIERSVEIIGEACGRVSPEFIAQHPGVPWSKIRRQRHRLAHEYDVINDATIWRVATVHVPVLIEAIEALLPPA